MNPRGRWCRKSRVSKRLGPNPKVTVSLAGRRASSGSVSASAGAPDVNRAASSVHSRISRPAASRSTLGRRSRAMKVAARLGRRLDARLVLAMERQHFDAPKGAAVDGAGCPDGDECRCSGQGGTADEGGTPRQELPSASGTHGRQPSWPSS